MPIGLVSCHAGDDAVRSMCWAFFCAAALLSIGPPPPEYRILPGRYITALPLGAAVLPPNGAQLGAAGSMT